MEKVQDQTNKQNEYKKIGKYVYNLGKPPKDTNVYQGYEYDDKTRKIIKEKKVAVSFIPCLMRFNKDFMEQYNDILKILKSEYIVPFKLLVSSETNGYVITEWCERGNLWELLKEEEMLSLDRAILIVRQISQALVDIQDVLGKETEERIQLVHTNICPKNILIGEDKVLLTGFGYSRKITEKNETVKIRIESVNNAIRDPENLLIYRSPEFLKTEEYSLKSDIWSLGIILYQLIHGRTPWNGRTQYSLFSNITEKDLDLSKLDGKTSELLSGMLLKNPTERWSCEKVNAYIDKNYDLKSVKLL